MKISLVTLGISLISSFSLLADAVIVQTVEGAGQNGPVTIFVKGDKIRTDIAKQISTIVDGSSGNLKTLMHDQKAYMEISAEAGLQLINTLKSQPGAPQASAEKPAFKATGKNETINGHQTEIYTLDSGNMKSTYWIAKDYPQGALVLDLHKQMQNNPLSKMAETMAPQPEELPGVPVKIEMQIEGGEKITTTLVSVEEKTLDDSTFTIPEDYKALAAPSFGGGAQ